MHNDPKPRAYVGLKIMKPFAASGVVSLWKILTRDIIYKTITKKISGGAENVAGSFGYNYKTEYNVLI